MKNLFLATLLLTLLVINCSTTGNITSANGTEVRTADGSSITIGYLYTEEAMFPGNFEGKPNAEFARYPEMAQRAGIEGTVIAYLDINEEGELLESRITRGIGGGCDETALGIIRNSTYTPAKNENAEPVSARHYVSIVFSL